MIKAQGIGWSKYLNGDGSIARIYHKKFKRFGRIVGIDYSKVKVLLRAKK
jgi:hypothetical protein